MAQPMWRRLTVRRLTIWLSLGLVCVTALFALALLRGIDRQIADVTQTYAVRNSARELTHALSQAESSQRGYLLTQNRQFLELFDEAMTTVADRRSQLLELTADDPQQAARLDGILGELSGKLAEMERTVELATSQREDEALSLTETGMGARLMAEVSRTLEAFITDEDAKLVQRNDEIDRYRHGLVVALMAALAAAAVLGYALLTRTQRQVSALAERHSGLVTQNEALEALVAERTRDIEEARAHAEHERQRVEALLQDTNHRIGNSLATVSSLLALQVMRSRSEEVRQALESARLRVHAVASAHRRLRLSDDLETACASDFLQPVLDDIAATQTDDGRITLSGDIAPVLMSSRDATTLGILVSELVTNSLKHAFPDGRRGAIRVRLFAGADDVAMLAVSDDGVGMPDGPPDEGGLGSVVIKQLAGQFGGAPDYQPVAGGGLCVVIAMPGLGQARTVAAAME
ncbi:MAG: hypothetical protein BGO80_02945 [Devosia sp. 63-57]|nr:MAG: hypothetical protein ABS74_01380 [Pelagibacterium sp. SCN 63-126]ODU82418.1 MAG: hypothetical protein ABT14_16805 [Pelagibacterium sp. SCN 63-17]OJX44536.1 MAG: hypothetical protein BGO80_02945 [Devosia sp. 63-57]